MRCKVRGVRCGVWAAGGQLSAASHQLSALSRLLFSASKQISITHCSLFTFLFLTSCLIPHISSAQSVSATLDRDKILLGEQVILELKAENINPQTTPLINWFSFPDTINHIEVIKRSPIDTLTVNGTISYTQNLTLTSFDSGNWTLLPLYTVLQHSDDSKKDTLTVTELTIQVLPVDVSNMQQYHQMKDIIDVEVQPDYFLIAGIVLLVIVSVVIIWFLVKNKKEKKPVLQPAAAQSLFETTISQLEKLQNENPPPILFYVKLDDICRTYIQNQLYIRAIQLTSDELMMQMNVYIQPDVRTDFYQLLRLISAVKFAKYQPEEAQKAAGIETAKAAIRHIYYQLQRNLLQHAD